MAKSNLNEECKNLELIIDNLENGKEDYDKEEAEYSLEEAVEYLRDFLQQLNGLNEQLKEQGNTEELLKKVHEKYTELWLFQLYFPIHNLPVVIGGLLYYPNN